MKASRRGFLQKTLAFGPIAMNFWVETDSFAAEAADCSLPDPGLAVRFIPNEPRIMTRYSAAEMAKPEMAEQLQKFRTAIQAVRDLPQNDVISWTKQVAQHCVNCAPSNKKNIHFDWTFLPWHRGLLYFLERILRNIVSDNDLRLVYWDWENPASRILPSIYAPSGQSLYWANRGPMTAPTWPLTNDAVDVQPLLSISDFRLFGGAATQRQPVPAVFSGPHANVHNAFYPGDMADLQYSPRDPVFFAHHSNIDRLWSSWIAAGHSNPDFGNARVFFYDENRQWRYVLMNDLRDESKLGYRYSSLMNSVTSPQRLLSFSVQEKQTNLFNLSTSQINLLSAGGDRPRFLILENIRNLEQLSEETIRYGIFSDNPPLSTQIDSANGYLGLVSRVFNSGHNHAGPLSAALNVTGKLDALMKKNSRMLKFFVAPLDASGKTTGAAIPLVADEIIISR